MNEAGLEVPSEEFSAAAHDLEFYIPATSSLLERRPRTLKHGDTFGLFDHYGDIVGGEGSPEGIFYRDTRYVSILQLLVNGRRPLLLSSTVQDNNAVLIADLTNPDIFDGDGRLILGRDTIHIVRSIFLWQGTVYQRIAVRNFGGERNRIALGIRFGGDFKDLFEVRGHHRPARGHSTIERPSPGTVALAYQGLDSAMRRIAVRFHPEPDQLEDETAAFALDLAPGERTSLFLSVACGEGETPDRDPKRYFVCLRAARRDLRRVNLEGAVVSTSNAIFNEVLCRSVADLRMLTTDTPEGRYPYAGIPWFSTAFGRDGIITAIQTLWFDPGIARGVLRFLAATQARERDPASDAEPGKILHEMRQGEMARLGEVPFGRYYGTIDATPLFVVLAGMYYARTGDLQTITALWPNIEAALQWIDAFGDRDGDGFVEYFRERESGLANQGWKDSHDSNFHADGELATGPIALSEVQGYVYAAKRHAATLARALGHSVVAATLEQRALSLKERFDAAFWSEELGTYVLALDGEKRACRVRASNAGHLLFTGLPDHARAVRIADQLLGRDFFSGWGIRTVAASESRYNPMSYHNGSVWPHDNALIALGFAHYRLTEHVRRLFSSLFEAAAYMDLRRLPELFCGFRRVPGKGPTFYPVACSPQAWAAAVPLALLHACLGMTFDPKGGELRLNHPRLPDFIDEVHIRSLMVGEARIDLLIRQYEADVTVHVRRRDGEARVSVVV